MHAHARASCCRSDCWSSRAPACKSRMLRQGGCCTGASVFGNGDRFCGEWAKDQQQGLGYCLYAAGGKYRGAWRQGMREGQGTFTFANGDTYTGAAWTL